MGAKICMPEPFFKVKATQLSWVQRDRWERLRFGSPGANCIAAAPQDWQAAMGRNVAMQTQFEHTKGAGG